MDGNTSAIVKLFFAASAAGLVVEDARWTHLQPKWNGFAPITGTCYGLKITQSLMRTKKETPPQGKARLERIRQERIRQEKARLEKEKRINELEEEKRINEGHVEAVAVDEGVLTNLRGANTAEPGAAEAAAIPEVAVGVPFFEVPVELEQGVVVGANESETPVAIVSGTPVLNIDEVLAKLPDDWARYYKSLIASHRSGLVTATEGLIFNSVEAIQKNARAHLQTILEQEEKAQKEKEEEERMKSYRLTGFAPPSTESSKLQKSWDWAHDFIRRKLGYPTSTATSYKKLMCSVSESA